MLGVVNELVPEPPARTTPPLAAANQSMVVPAGLVAEMVTIPGPHLDPLTGDAGAVGKGLMVAVTTFARPKYNPLLYFLPLHNMLLSSINWA
jgi:hypothetical protein